MKKEILVGCAVIVGVAVLGFKTLGRSRGNNPTRPVTGTVTSLNSTYTLTEVEKHMASSDCWMAIEGNVYNVSGYVSRHPNSQILDGCGKDATIMFNQVRKHMGEKQLLATLKIGTLAN